MGADYFEQDQQGESAGCRGEASARTASSTAPSLTKTRLSPTAFVMTPEGKRNDFDGENYFIRDGIVVVPKKTTIPVGFWI
jgi:glucose-1-phosphate adenylyltransferase